MPKRLLVCLCVLLGGAGLARAQTPAAANLPPSSANAVVPIPVAGCPDATQERFWFQSDYLLWWVRKAPAPPLITTGPFDPNTFVPGVSPTPGGLSSPGTQVLYSGTGFGAFSGLQAQGGLWLDDEQSLGIEGGGFFLGRQTRTFTAASNASGAPFLGTPFFDPFTGRESVQAVAFANDAANIFGGAAGSLTVDNTLQLWGMDFNFTSRAWASERMKLDLLLGFRYVDLHETLTLTGASTPIGLPFLGNAFNPAPVLGEVDATRDSFRTRNQFYGGQLGARAGWLLTERLDLDLLFKLGLGNMHQRLDVNGQTVITAPGAAALVGAGGLLAQPSNIGAFHQDRFAVVPEINFNIGYRVTDHFRVSLGYSFLYLSSVIRPGDQIDRNIDSRQIPTSQNFTPNSGATSPAPRFERTDFWAQGLNFGVEFRY